MNWKALAASLVLGLAFGLVCPRASRAAQPKDKQKDPTPEEEASEAANEEAAEAEITDMLQQLAKLQRDFRGTFLLPSDSSQNTGRGVVGTFVTDKADKMPGRTYLVKVTSDDVLKTLSRYDTKKVTVHGKLRNKDKYLIVDLVIEPPPPIPPTIERRSPGRL